MPSASPIAPHGPARALKALRRFSRLLTEADTPEALSRDLCRVLVEDCGYRLAWVGLREDDADRTVRPIASYGFEEGYLNALRVSWSEETERGRGPSGVCVREGRTCVALDMQTDPRLAPWREEALRRGYRSSAGIPLGAGKPARGTLSVYSAEAGAFAAEELELLEELAADLDRGLSALKAREERAVLALALEQSSDAVMLTDARGTILLVNPAFEALTGHSRSEALGRTPRILKSGLMPGDYYERMWECLRSGKVWAGRVVNKRKDGTLYTADCRTAPVRAPGGTITFFVCVQHDVTEQLALQERLMQAQKMEAVGRLAGGVAHDFNNLLTCIMGACDLALERSSPVDPRRLELEDIRRASDRAAALTRQLLAFSRKQVVSPKVLEAGAVVRGLDGMLRRLLREDIAVEVDAACRVRVLVDAGQLEQVVVNLAVNARDALPAGGRLRITVSEEAVVRARSAHGQTLKPGRYAVIAVTDDGCGIPAAALPHVFEPFFTTKGQAGTGLGLSTVHDIAESAGGAVLIDSNLGAGTTIRVYLPATDAPAAPAAAPFKPAQAREGTETILLVEDDEMVRRILRRHLVTRGYEVLEAGTPAEAEKVVTGHHGRIDLLVCDVVLPGTNGWALAEKLGKRRQGMRLLFISGYAQDAAALEAAIGRGAHFLPKPVSSDELSRKVREALAT